MRDDLQSAVVGWRNKADKAARRRLQAAVIKAYRPLVARFVRRTVPVQHREEARQVVCIGLLLALEHCDPELLGEQGGERFWFAASRYVRDELQRWLDSGVYWRRRDSLDEVTP